MAMPDEAVVPPALRTTGQTPRRSALRVQWHEESIAEQDKERGTRQKIDEPPTPFCRSPLSASEEEDEEGGDRGTDSASRAGQEELDPTELTMRIIEMVSEGLPQDADNSKAEDAPSTNVLVHDSIAAVGADIPECDSPPSRGTKRRADDSLPRSDGAVRTPSRERHVVMPGAGEPRKSSASFRAKRAQHYDEFKLLREFREKQARGEVSDEEA
mmetsp:Transcript_44314/g.117534  ORF Transcript_44314/g.117534 Transcript_44314/m.117534 type:complete len:214 (-) Transcript_44314:78-719(-)